MSPTATGQTAGAAAGGGATDEVRLARLHLRVGMLSLAASELEDLERRAFLGTDERALLAEARWRTGDGDGAVAAARAHLDAGGEDPVALCIAAEAASADGRPGEARSFMDRLGPPDAATLDALFAGMPRRAFWPSAPSEPAEAATLFAELGQAPEGAGAPTPSRAGRLPVGSSHGVPEPRARETSVPGPRQVMDATAQELWSSGAGERSGGSPTEEADVGSGVGRPRRHAAPALGQDPAAELARARSELTAEPERALLRLSLTLRLDPTLAPAVLDAIAGRTDPGAALLRGDAQRLLGRHLEAEAAFASAAASLTDHGRADAGRSGRS